MFRSNSIHFLTQKLIIKIKDQHKVYDAWQYVESLRATLTYMNVSCELLEKVYEHRIEALSTQEQKNMETAVKKGKASIREEDLSCTNLDIVGLVIDDSMCLRKNKWGFFTSQNCLEYQY